MLLTRQQILGVGLNRTPRARNGSDRAIAIVIKIFIRRESAGKIGGKPIRTKTRHLLSNLRFTQAWLVRDRGSPWRTPRARSTSSSLPQRPLTRSCLLPQLDSTSSAEKPPTLDCQEATHKPSTLVWNVPEDLILSWRGVYLPRVPLRSTLGF
jgi:hypothetical protein